jgi:hypothetical protein
MSEMEQESVNVEATIARNIARKVIENLQLSSTSHSHFSFQVCLEPGETIKVEVSVETLEREYAVVFDDLTLKVFASSQEKALKKAWMKFTQTTTDPLYCVCIAPAFFLNTTIREVNADE